MSKNTLQDKLKASIQSPAATRPRTTRTAAVKTASESKPVEAVASAPAPAAKPAKPAEPKKIYLNDDRVWPD